MAKDSDTRISLDAFAGMCCNVTNLFRTLQALTTPIGIQASLDGNYRGAVFGRDSLRVGLDLFQWLPELAENILISLAWLQGDSYDEDSEEAPGRIPHEYRPSLVGRRPLTREQSATYQKLRHLWKGSDEAIVYYGSVDSTPQFIRLIGELAALRGQQVLDTEFLHKSGEVRTLRASVLYAAEWIERSIASSELSLLEFRRTNPNGHRYQTMRDGVSSYIHGQSGELANPDLPIASIEIQGLAFDALRIAAQLCTHQPQKSKRFLSVAEDLRDATLRTMWLPDRDFFAMGIDRGPTQRPRLITTYSSLPAELLETQFFDDLSVADRRRYVCPVVNSMFSSEFLTPVGIRNLGRQHSGLLPYWDFQGPHAVWPAAGDSFARGLRRQGLVDQAIDQENRLLNGLNMAGGFAEFFYVDEDSRVDYRQKPLMPATEREIFRIPAVDVPHANQAWTLSAALRAVLERAGVDSGHPKPATLAGTPLQSGLADDVLQRATRLIGTEAEAIAAYPKDYEFMIDTREGLRLLREHWSKQGVTLYHPDPANPGV